MDEHRTTRKARAACRLRLQARNQRQAGAQVLVAWISEEDALKVLSERQQQIRAEQTDRAIDVTLDVMVKHYLKFKTDHGKRSLQGDKRILEKQLLPSFGGGLPIRQLSAGKISAYEEQRITTVSPWTVRNELTILRYMLRLAHKKWGYIDRVPDIEFPKAPRGRTRFLTEDEITRLFQACTQSKNKHLPAIVALAIHTGMRKSEILNLRWEQIELDKAPGNTHIRLYDTKTGEVRGVPLSTDAIAALTLLESAPLSGRGVYSSKRTGRTGDRSGPRLRMPSNGRHCQTSNFTICATRRRVT